MAYKCSFLDNETYIAQDVNDIFARITSGGVIFSDTGYTLGDLNNAQSQVATSGVTRDTNSCKVVKEGSVYKISKGACFMDDGTAIIFDDDGQQIEIVPEVVNYVYLERNVVANSIDVVVSQQAGDENSIPLAEVDENGNIFDRRKYAKAKVDLTTSGAIRNFTLNFEKCSSSGSDTLTVDMGDGAFSYIIMWDGERVYNDSHQARVPTSKNLVELEEGADIYLYIGKYVGGHEETIHCKKDGQNLHMRIINPSSSADYVFNMGVI